MPIRFFKPYITGKEITYIDHILKDRLDMAGDGIYTKKVQRFLENRYGAYKALLTTSCTTALELAIRLLDLNDGDEIIVPSFTFSSTVNAILLRSGIKAVFADVLPTTLNIDPDDIEKKITDKTRALMIVHYAGVACDMDRIMRIAKKHKLKVIEDAAQAIESKYNGKYLGTFGDFGCFSFHDTKNITCGEGGALLINSNDLEILEKAEILREKGTNRSKFFRGQIDKYTWVDVGSSMLPSDILAAYLLAQLESVEKITRSRMEAYEYYKINLLPFVAKGMFQIPFIPKNTVHNAHIFFLLFNTGYERDFVLQYMRKHGVSASFHYIPLHSAPQGIKLGYKPEDMPVTEELAHRLLRLPIYSSMKLSEKKKVINTLKAALKALENEKPDVSIGISAFNEGKNIYKLLEQITSQNQNNFKFKEILIYSDGSTDKTVENAKRVKSPFVKVINDTQRRGKSFRINQICRDFKGEYLILLDGDIRLSNKYVLSEIVKTFKENPDVAVVGGNTRPDAPKTFFEKIVFSTFHVFDESRKSMKSGHNIFGCTGACIGLRKKFAKSLFFPSVLNEDDYIYFSCLNEGLRFLHNPKAIVYYKLPTKLVDYLKQIYRSNPEAVSINIDKYFGEIVAKEYYRPYSFYLFTIFKTFFKMPLATFCAILINVFSKPFYGIVTKNYKINWFTAVSTK